MNQRRSKAIHPQYDRNLKKVLAGIVIAGLALVGGIWATGTGQIWQSPPDLTTDNPATGPQAVTVVAVGDLSCEKNNPFYNAGLGTPRACQARATSDLAISMNPAYVMTLGDEQYRSGKLKDFEGEYAKTWGRLKTITNPVPGNHEYGTKNARGYYAYFGSEAGSPMAGYYSYNIGAWHIVAMNGNCKQVGGCQKNSAQEQWLHRDLASHSNRCTLAYWHQPRFSSGGHGSDATYTAFWQDLENYQADVVLAGHDHDYERFVPMNAIGTPDPNGPREFVIGTGGESLTAFTTIRAGSVIRDNQDYGVMKLILDSDQYSWEYVTTGHQLKDEGTAACYDKASQPYQAGPASPQPLTQ